MNVRKYFYSLLARYLSYHIQPDDSLVEIDPVDGFIAENLRSSGISVLRSPWSPHDFQGADAPDFILLNGNVHYEPDIQAFLERVRGLCAPRTRLIIVYYSSLWRPLMGVASRVGLRRKTPEKNWVAHEDIENLLALAGYQMVSRRSHVLVPLWIPVVGWLCNRFLAAIPPFNMFCMVNIAVARPVAQRYPTLPSVSIVIPARNEEGNIERILERIPPIGSSDEIVFVEGGSKDRTWDRILEASRRAAPNRRIVAVRQDGAGKGDAVRKGFSAASGEILMILDADMAVAPEELPKFYRAIVEDRGEFISGSRLVYPMERRAMRFVNMVGNKFFALAFSRVLGQRFKDTLCGTKALSRDSYRKIVSGRAFFGDFDPFGDFDLLFGAARLGLKIVELPVPYRERTYGTTNISRWKHGLILLRMLLFATRRIVFR